MGQVEDEEVKSFLEELRAESFDDEEDRKAIERLSKNEKFAQKFAKGRIGQKELYRRMNKQAEEKLELERAKAEAAAERAALKEWKKVADETLTKTQSEAQALREKMEKQEKLYRSVGMDEEAERLADQRAEVDSDLTKKELESLKKKFENTEKMLREQQQGFQNTLLSVPGFTAKALKLSKQYVKEGFDVDEEAAINLGLSNGGNLDAAFEELVKDQRKKREEEATQKRIEAAVEKAKQEFRTQQSSPDGFGGAPVPGFFKMPEGGREGYKSRLEAAKAEVKQNFQQAFQK